MPSEAEATEAGALVEAFEAHRKKGIGAFAFQGRLVDAPIMDRAIRVLKRWRIGNAE